MREFDDGKENYFTYYESGELRGKAEQIVRKFIPAWLALATTADDVEYVKQAIDALVDERHIREVSRGPLQALADERLAKLTEVPV